MSFPFSLFSSSSLVGIDIQSDGIRLLQLKKRKNKWAIACISASSLPNDLFENGRIKEFDLLSQCLTELVHSLEITGQRAAICLAANLVRTQHIELPIGMHAKEIEKEIYATVERDFPSMTETLCVDFSETAHSRRGYRDIFFCVTREEYLYEYVNAIQAAGLIVSVVDIDIYALQRAFLFSEMLPAFFSNQEKQNVGVQAILYAMNKMASLIFFDDYNILFHQQWDICDATDFHTQLKSRAQIFFSTFGEMGVAKLTICTSSSYLSLINQEIAKSWEGNINYFSAFSEIEGEKVAQELLVEHNVQFMIACGLALRGLVRW